MCTLLKKKFSDFAFAFPILLTDGDVAKLSDEKCSQIERNGGKFNHIELCNCVFSNSKFSNSALLEQILLMCQYLAHQL